MEGEKDGEKRMAAKNDRQIPLTQNSLQRKTDSFNSKQSSGKTDSFYSKQSPGKTESFNSKVSREKDRSL